jgi:hypothetical protein
MAETANAGDLNRRGRDPADVRKAGATAGPADYPQFTVTSRTAVRIGWGLFRTTGGYPRIAGRQSLNVRLIEAARLLLSPVTGGTR